MVVYIREQRWICGQKWWSEKSVLDSIWILFGTIKMFSILQKKKSNSITSLYNLWSTTITRIASCWALFQGSFLCTRSVDIRLIIIIIILLKITLLWLLLLSLLSFRRPILARRCLTMVWLHNNRCQCVIIIITIIFYNISFSNKVSRYKLYRFNSLTFSHFGSWETFQRQAKRWLISWRTFLWQMAKFMVVHRNRRCWWW